MRWFRKAEPVVIMPCVAVDGAFTASEIAEITASCAQLPMRRAMVMAGGPNKRVSNVGFFDRKSPLGWVFPRLEKMVRQANGHYGFKLRGFDEVQYAEYGEGGRYDWHIDAPMADRGLMRARKLSMTLLLNEPGGDFDGGDFQFIVGTPDPPMTAAVAKGRALFFPAWMPHRVTPVPKGVRKSLTIWVDGPKFT